MSGLPALTARDIIRVLQSAGFVIRRTKGSHCRLVHRDDARRATTVPVHGSATIPKPLVLRILKQAGLSADEFRRLLRGARAGAARGSSLILDASVTQNPHVSPHIF